MKKLILIALAFSIILSHAAPVFAVEKTSFPTATISSTVDEASKTADMRVAKLKGYLEAKGSPMADDARHFITEADRLGLDWKLVAAIAGNESYFGQHVPYNSYNGWGWAVWTGMSYGADFNGWGHGITTVSEGLKYEYIDDGLVTIEQIGHRYAADPFWSDKVKFFMDQIETFEPDSVKLLTLAL